MIAELYLSTVAFAAVRWSFIVGRFACTYIARDFRTKASGHGTIIDIKLNFIDFSIDFKIERFQAEEAERIGTDDADISDINLNVHSPAK